MIRRFDEATDVLDIAFEYNNKETASLNLLANYNGQVDLDLLRRIALWKLDRVLNVPSEIIRKLQALVTDADLRANSAETQSLIGELFGCDGVGLPMASTILKFLRPDVFSIIDIRAYRALYGKKPYFSQSKDQKNIDCYLAYVGDICRIGRKLHRPLRDIDEQLKEFDKKHNGRI